MDYLKYNVITYYESVSFVSLLMPLSGTWWTCFPRANRMLHSAGPHKIAERLDIQSGNFPWWVAAAQQELRSPTVTVCHAFPFPPWPPNPEGTTLLRRSDGCRISEGPLLDLWAPCFCLAKASSLFLLRCKRLQGEIMNLQTVPRLWIHRELLLSGHLVWVFCVGAVVVVI